MHTQDGGPFTAWDGGLMDHGTRTQIVIPKFKIHTSIGVNVLETQNLHTHTHPAPGVH